MAHLSSLAALLPGAIAEMEKDFDEIEQELRSQAAEPAEAGSGPVQGLSWLGSWAWAGHAMKGMSSAGMVTKGRIMSRSSCSRMWQWYM